jgi:DNA polymerase III subunit epsilon
MDLVTICDTETTGVRSNDAVIELGAILYSLKLATPIATYSELIPTEVKMSSEKIKGCTASEINGITPELLAKVPENFSSVRRVLGKFLAASEVILAHNASFDQRFIGDHPTFKDKKWVCTMNHVKWPRVCPSKALSSIALAHGVPIVSAHRALTDCDILARLLTKVHEMGHDLSLLIDKACRPHILVRALVDKANKDLAVDAGFYFNYESKRWLKEVAEEDFDEGLDFPFNCVRC